MVEILQQQAEQAAKDHSEYIDDSGFSVHGDSFAIGDNP
jgi:hypothetical protein